MNEVQLHLGYAGYCLAKESEAIKGGTNKKIKFFALWGLIKHPSEGYILYDTGYTNRFHSETKNYPNKIYAQITKVVIKDNESVKKKLLDNGINPKEIKHIIITHFHADHVGGLKDFPNARFYTSIKAFKHFKKLNPLIAFSRGILKGLVPKNLSERIILIDKECKKFDNDLFGDTYDLFGDNSISIVKLPGHAAGQIGVQLKTKKNDYFLIADACWNSEAFKNKRFPSPIVALFFDSWNQYIKTIGKITKFHLQKPSTIIVPTHCRNTTDQLISTKINFNEL